MDIILLTALKNLGALCVEIEDTDLTNPVYISESYKPYPVDIFSLNIAQIITDSSSTPLDQLQYIFPNCQNFTAAYFRI